MSFDLVSAQKEHWQAKVVALPQPKIAKALSFGYEAVLADLYWVGGVHYFGENANQFTQYGELVNYINLVNELAPDFQFAYIFGGMAIPWNRGDKWVNIDGAVHVLRRGVERFPNNWYMRLMLAYDLSTYLGQYREAGEQLAIAAKIPGSPPYLASLATRMVATEGDLNEAEELAIRLYRENSNPLLQEPLRRRIFEIRTLKGLKELQAKVNEFHQLKGAYPESLQALVTAGLIPEVPREPLGGTYNIDPKTGEVSSSEMKDRLKIHVQATHQ